MINLTGRVHAYYILRLRRIIYIPVFSHYAQPHASCNSTIKLINQPWSQWVK